MPHGLPAAFLEAVLAHFAVAKKCGSWAKEPVIVECLHDGNTQIPARVIGRRRNERKRVVEMDDVRFVFLEQQIELIPSGR